MARSSGLGNMLFWGGLAVGGYMLLKNGKLDLGNLLGGPKPDEKPGGIASYATAANNWGGVPAGGDQSSWQQFNNVIDGNVSTPWVQSPGQFASRRGDAYNWWRSHGSRWPSLADLG